MTAVIYARQSLDRDGEGTAVTRQVAECYDLAKRNNLTIAREFIDNDVSASKGVRPAFVELLNSIRAGEVSTIVVWHTDRLYRRVRDLVELVELAEKHSLRILTVRAGDLDLNNPAGRMMAQMLGAAARYEVEQKSVRQVASNVQRAKKGIWQFSQRPYGYDRVDGVITIREDEAEVIRGIINAYINGDSWYGIMKDLNARGIKTQTGKEWTHENVRNRALNPAYAGIRHYRSAADRAKDAALPESERRGKSAAYRGDVATEEGQWPPIIDRETWARFENVLNSRRPEQTWAKKLKYLGSGLYRCGKCGDVMIVGWDYGNGKREKFAVYQCRKFDVRRRLELVDQEVEYEVLARLGMPERVNLLMPSEDESLLGTRAKEIRDRIDGLAELYADGILTAINVREQKAKLQEQLDDITRRLNASEGGSVISDLMNAENIAAHWQDKVSLRDKRRIIDALMTVTIMPVKKRGGSNEFNPEEIVFTDRTPE